MRGWRKNKLKKVLVTGAGGLVGYDVAKLLASNSDYQVYATVHNRTIDDLEHIIQIDLQNMSLETLKINFEYIVHCAASIPGGKNSDERVAYENRCIDDNIIAYCINHECRLVYISTAAVYDYESGTLLTETTELKINSGYKYEKRNSELKIINKCDSYCILRISSPYGPRQKNMAVIKRFIDAVYRGENIFYFGTGKRTQNFIDVRDIAQAVLKCIECKENGIFNIASENAISMRELADLIVKIGKKEFSTASEVHAANEADMQENVRVNIDIGLAEKILGWKPQIQLQDGVNYWMQELEE